jgi:hypothetical protein
MSVTLLMINSLGAGRQPCSERDDQDRQRRPARSLARSSGCDFEPRQNVRMSASSWRVTATCLVCGRAMHGSGPAVLTRRGRVRTINVWLSVLAERWPEAGHVRHPKCSSRSMGDRPCTSRLGTANSTMAASRLEG